VPGRDGTLSSHIGWTTLDEAFAWSRGWRTRSFTDAAVIHRRRPEQAFQRDSLSARGRAEYLTWSDPLFVLGKSMKIESLRGLYSYRDSIFGFLQSYLRKESRSRDRALVRARRTYQRNRMKRILGLVFPGQARYGHVPNLVETTDSINLGHRFIHTRRAFC